MIVFETPGLIDQRAFTIMGLSAKPGTPNPIGYFGTGLKYAIAVLVRLGADVVVFIGRDEYRFGKEPGEFRGKKYDKLIMQAKPWRKRVWGQTELPFTTDYGRNWKPWMCFRELEANTRDENGRSWKHEGEFPGGAPDCTRIIIQLQEFDDAYDSRDEVFLPGGARERPAGGVSIEVVARETKSLYWRGLKVYEMHKPGIFTYNFLDHLVLTEDRTLATEFYARWALGNWLVKCEDEDLIEKIITVDDDYWEHEVEIDPNVAPSAAFHRVMMRHPKNVNATIIGYYSNHDRRVETRVLSPWEAHTLPWALDGMKIVDAKGVTIFEPPYGYRGAWTVVAKAVLDKVNPPAEPPAEVNQDDDAGSLEGSALEDELQATAEATPGAGPGDEIPF